ncbi:MAG: hydroxyacid dehydrogenase [Rubricella sp.]
MSTIVITEFMDEAAVDRLHAAHDTLYDPGLADRQDDIPALLEDARALIVRNRTRVTARLMDAGPGLCCIGRLGVGLDNIAVPEAAIRNITVIPATGANDDSVAEYVVTTAMMLLRGAYLSTEDVAAGSWPRQHLIGREIGGRTVGLVGFGSIARQAARRFRALGTQVIAHDPFLAADDPVWSEHRVARVALEALLERADVVSLHVPLTDATRNLIGAEALARMRDDAVLVNAARGGVVDESALAAALRDGSLGGAALDVFAEEPLGAGSPLAGCPNLILTPHIAGVTGESNVRVSTMIADRVLAALG